MTVTRKMKQISEAVSAIVKQDTELSQVVVIPVYSDPVLLNDLSFSIVDPAGIFTKLGDNDVNKLLRIATVVSLTTDHLLREVSVKLMTKTDSLIGEVENARRQQAANTQKEEADTDFDGE